jgi:hypothetical protein
MMSFFVFVACCIALFMFVRHLQSRAFVNKWQPRVRALAPVGRYLRADYRALRQAKVSRLRVPDDLSEL